MDQELEKEAQTSTILEQEVKTDIKPSLDSLPRLEDLLKTEQEIKTEQRVNIQGLTAVKKETSVQDRVFTREEDQKKAFVKRRVKTVTCVYGVVVALLLAFVGINLFTLIKINNDISSNTQTMLSESKLVQNLENSSQSLTDPSGSFEISLNEPRDYSEDDKELTMFDKISILFRNLFG